MIVLAIETATGPASVAVSHDGVVVASEASDDAQGHVEYLMPAIERVCSVAGVGFAGVDAIAVDVGPGAFTGLRAGVATAKALAHSLGRPVIAVGSLEALFSRTEVRPVWACVDARRGRIYAQRSDASAPEVLTPVELAGRAAGEPAIGAAAYDEISALEWISRDPPTAADVAAAAGGREPVRASAVEPVYLRGPAGEIDWASRGAILRPQRVKIAGER